MMKRLTDRILISILLALVSAIPFSFLWQIPPVKVMGLWNYMKYFPKSIFPNSGAMFNPHWVYFYSVAGLCLGYFIIFTLWAILKRRH